MPDDRGTLRHIAWNDVFPWLCLLRSLRLAIQVRLLALSSAGILLTIAGWWVCGQVFSGSSDERLAGWIESYAQWPQPSSEAPAAWNARGMADDVAAPPHFGATPGDAIFAPWHNLTGPFRQLFDPGLSISALAFLLLCGLWVDAVWSFFGGAITRLVSLELGRGERASLRAALVWARGRWHAYFTAPLFPLLGVLLFILPLAVVGLLGRTGALGLGVLGILWPLFLVASLAMTIFMVGLTFGWPLMWPTISTEGTDSFDALSRSYSYVYQRPLYYLFLVAVAGVLGALGWTFVGYFARSVAFLAAWGVSWGAGGIVLDTPEALAEAGWLAGKLIAFWTGAVHLVAASFAYSFFFTAATIIYYLLRHDVDGTETDEVFVEEQEEKFGLPPLATDEAGVAVVADAAVDGQPADRVTHPAE